MTREEAVAVATSLFLAVALLGGIYDNFWTLNSVLSLVPYFLLAGIIAALAWGFGGRIEGRPAQPTKPSKEEAELPPPIPKPVLSWGHMLVKIGTVEVREPDLIGVAPRGIGFPGFDFQGVAPEARVKQIADSLEAEKGSGALPCEAVMKNGKRISGYGKLEQFESRATENAPVMCRFSGVVTLLR